MMSKWPKDNPEALRQFYGDPGSGAVQAALVPVVPPFKMYYEGKPIKAIQFHKKAAPALKAALDEIWEVYGHDQKKIDALGISSYAGSYNPRKIAGSNKWSNHAYGAAIDLDADRNGFNKGKGTIPAPVIAAFKRQGARWGGDYKGRTDPMHFEFCDNGESEVQKFVDAPQTDADGGDNDEPENTTEDKKTLKDLSDKLDALSTDKPWYTRAWTWVAGTLFGGGLTVGGVTLDANTILAVCLLLVIVGVFGLIYWFLIRNK